MVMPHACDDPIAIDVNQGIDTGVLTPAPPHAREMVGSSPHSSRKTISFDLSINSWESVKERMGEILSLMFETVPEYAIFRLLMSKSDPDSFFGSDVPLQTIMEPIHFPSDESVQ